MQKSKGIVTTIVVLLTLACLYSYISLWPTSSVESDARAYAESMTSGGTATAKQQAYSHYLDSVSDEKIWGIPLVKEFTYSELKKSQLGLGLDLKGGMSVVLQVDLRDFLESLSGNNTDPAFQAALDQATQMQTTQQADYITLFAQAWKEKGGGRTLASLFNRSDALKTEGINNDSPDAATLTAVRKLANQTVDETYKRLKERIDKLGVVQPNVNLDAQRDLILVDLPGIDNPERARKFLEQSAKLEFWETYRITDDGVLQAISDADKRLKALTAGTASQDSVMVYPKDPTTGRPDSTKAMIKVPASDTTSTSGPLFTNLLINASSQGVPPSPILGWVDKNKRDLVKGYLNRPEIRQLFPTDLDFRFANKPEKDRENTDGTPSVVAGKYALYVIKKNRGSEIAPLDGSVVVGASEEPDPKGEIGVSLRMNQDGAKIWSGLTKKAYEGGQREIAIALDDEIVSAPSVRSVIDGGVSSITGGFNLDEARDLARILEVGKLPARLHIVQESQVGPSLGQENINASLMTMLLSVAALCLFMWWYYAKGGIVSIIAMLANLFFLIGTLAEFGTVLTLPGIAGIVLILAAAVDANVITYERIREEMRHGMDVMKAIGVGFSRSLPAILDANITTILTAVVLMYYGLGPIKGFGTVLIFGIISSVFTAVLLARLLTDWYTDRGGVMSYTRPSTANVMADVNIDWISKRKTAYMISGAIIAIGVASFFMRGFELGIDFKGGFSFNIEFAQPVEEGSLRTAMNNAFGGNPVIKKISTSGTTYNVTTSYLVTEQGAMPKVVEKLYEGVKALDSNVSLADFQNSSSTGTHIQSSSQVGATVADDIRASSFKAGLIAMLLIFLYLLIRFRRWQFSMGAVLALIHDVLITLTFFTLLHGFVPFSLEIDQAIIACILTVVGFSVNDTVIVYDRIREFIRTFAGQPKEVVFNKAINSTLTRTLITSGTVAFVVLLLFFFGGSATRGFAFGMLVGMIFGTYSSVFIASALVVDLTKEKVLSGHEEVKAVPTADKAKAKA